MTAYSKVDHSKMPRYRRAVFVDRDGTLIDDVGYLCHPREIRVLQDVPQGLALLREQGLKIVLVTNQSGVARGYFSEKDLDLVHMELQRRLGAFDGLYYCPHHPTEGFGEYRRVCDCRKPKAGMIRRACAELGLDPRGSYVVGDQITDIVPGREVGAKGVFLGGEERQARGLDATDNAPWVVIRENFAAAARWIVRDVSQAAGRGVLDRAPRGRR